MKRIALLVLLVLIPASAFAQSTRRYIVVTRQPAAEALQRLRGDDFEPRQQQRVRQFKNINAFAADLTEDEVATLEESDSVRWVEPVIERHLLADTITPGAQTTPYGLNMVHATDVWPVTRGLALGANTKIRVAVIDTGIRFTENDLKGVYRGGFNFITGTENPYDDHGHGTHVSGTIAAADDGAGVVGVAPQIELYGLKVLNQCGSGSSENTILAVEWIIAKKAQIGGNWIINLSLGSDTPSDAEKAEFQKAADAGILVFAASGNGYEGAEGLAYPAGYPTVIAVGAVDSASQVADFSQRGVDLKIVAPGVEVLSTFVSEGLTTSDGRDFAVFDMDAKRSNGDAICFTRPTNVSNMPYVFCGYGGSAADFPSSVAGKIALIERGNAITFADKAKNAKAAGAIAAIIFNNVPGAFSGTLGTLTGASAVPYTVSLSQEDGKSLLTTLDARLTLSFGREGYALLQGTSMSSPHAAGVAALVWAVAPTASATTVANAIFNTARDLGSAGVDNVYGHGLVNALDAAKMLNPAAFSSGATPSTGPVTGRAPGRRGR